MRQANTPARSDQYVLALHSVSPLNQATVAAHNRREAILAAHKLELDAPAQVLRALRPSLASTAKVGSSGAV